MDRKKTFTW